MTRSESWSTEERRRTWRDEGRTVREFTGFMLPKMKRLTVTLMRRRMKFLTFISRKVRLSSGMIQELGSKTFLKSFCGETRQKVLKVVIS